MRTTRSGLVAPSTEEDGCVYDASDGDDEDIAGEHSCIAFEQERMHEAAGGLTKLGMKSSTGSTKRLRKALRGREERAIGDGSTPRPQRVAFPCHFLGRSWTRWSLRIRWR
ncbi:hypothetical protein ACSQ67_026228 [Phaseolus vulgaris]